jgi:DNA replication protein DnaC
MSPESKAMLDAAKEQAWAERIPAEFRDRRLSDFSPAYAVHAERLLDREFWSLYLFGGVGSGKTSFAVAVMRQWIETRAGWPVLVTSTRMAQTLKDFGVAPSSVLTWTKAPLLVLDDLGRNRATEFIKEHVVDLIAPRLDDHRPTIVTSNLTINELSAMFDHPKHRRLGSRLGAGVYINFGDKDRRRQA